MSSLESAADRLISEVLASGEYAAYRRELELVKQRPGLKEQIDDFRSRNYELQSSAENDFNRLDAFEKEYEDFREDALVQDFLAAELDFCRMMQGLYARITAALDFE